MDLRQDMESIFRRACEAHPGLAPYRAAKKGLLWGAMGFFVLIRVLEGVLYWRAGQSLLAVLRLPLGLVIPGIFVLSVWRGGWKFSFLLLLPAGSLAMGLVQELRVTLLLGFDHFRPMAYVITGVEAATVLYLVWVVLWLSLPERNRKLSAVLNQVTEEQIRRSKELMPPPRSM